MPTISAKVSKKELDIIQEYANACGETISNLLRKSVLCNATFMNCYGDSNEYYCNISVLDNMSGEEENKIILGKINKIRDILGLKEQDWI